MKLNLKNVGLEADVTNCDKTDYPVKLIIVVNTQNVKKLKFLFPLSIYIKKKYCKIGGTNSSLYTK